MDEEKKPSVINDAILAVMEKLPAIPKDTPFRDKSGRVIYSYRSADSIVNTVRPLFVKYGIRIECETISNQGQFVATKTGTAYKVELDLKYWFVARDDSRTFVTVHCEANDNGDKATKKCYSISLKEALEILLMIAPDEEQDATNLETTGPAPSHNNSHPSKTADSRKPTNTRTGHTSQSSGGRGGTSGGSPHNNNGKEWPLLTSLLTVAKEFDLMSRGFVITKKALGITDGEAPKFNEIEGDEPRAAVLEGLMRAYVGQNEDRGTAARVAMESIGAIDLRDFINGAKSGKFNTGHLKSFRENFEEQLRLNQEAPQNAEDENQDGKLSEAEEIVFRFSERGVSKTELEKFVKKHSNLWEYEECETLWKRLEAIEENGASVDEIFG